MKKKKLFISLSFSFNVIFVCVLLSGCPLISVQNDKTLPSINSTMAINHEQDVTSLKIQEYFEGKVMPFMQQVCDKISKKDSELNNTIAKNNSLHFENTTLENKMQRSKDSIASLTYQLSEILSLYQNEKEKAQRNMLTVNNQNGIIDDLKKQLNLAKSDNQEIAQRPKPKTDPGFGMKGY